MDNIDLGYVCFCTPNMTTHTAIQGYVAEMYVRIIEVHGRVLYYLIKIKKNINIGYNSLQIYFISIYNSVS